MPVGSSWPMTAPIPEPSKPISGIRGAAMSNLKIYEVPLSRETKLAMVLDRRSPSYGKIIQTYATRNHCAHGGMTSPVGSINSLESNLYTWQGELVGS